MNPITAIANWLNPAPSPFTPQLDALIGQPVTVCYVIQYTDEETHQMIYDNYELSGTLKNNRYGDYEMIVTDSPDKHQIGTEHDFDADYVVSIVDSVITTKTYDADRNEHLDG